MKHFTMKEWVDFARGAVGKDAKFKMQNHLDSGCQECAKEARLWQHVNHTAKREAQSEPPEAAIRIAKALMATSGFRDTEKAGRAIAQLIFDSFKVPLAVGVRSESKGPRQLLYGAGNHRIDLRMEPQADSEKVVIIGQVLDSSNPDQMLSKVPISLHIGTKRVATSETNHLGEFQLECELAGRLELRATLPQGNEIKLSLVEPTAPGSKESTHLYDLKRVKKTLREGRSTRKKV
jgi:hypothetical protein